MTSMSFPAKAVANEFLELARKGEPISPMKLQKLVYYAHGWYMGFTKDPLIDEQVECWKHGPVVNSLFHEFKEFGSDHITRLAKRLVMKQGKGLAATTPRVPKDAEFPHTIVSWVWGAYGPYSAVKLSNMTHLPGGPWDRVMKKYGGSPPRGTDIPPEWIREHFEKLANEASS